MADQEIATEVEEHILQQTQWEGLPSTVKKLVANSKDVWAQTIIKYSLRRQLRWKNNLIKTIIQDERAYYNELLRQSKMNLMLYPYHLQDILVKGLKIPPFRYYHGMMEDIMKNEKSYDILPNFVAADCVRLLGIGRNQFIDIMNKSRAKLWPWKNKAQLLKELLPVKPVPNEIEYWWQINVGFVSEEDIRGCTEPEHLMIDQLIDCKHLLAGELDKEILNSLYGKNFIYVDVPIYAEDYISVPPLEGFVMTRTSGDYFERLLYKLFVSIDERTTIQQLATVLQIPIEMVQIAVSVYCRLGFAKKKNLPPLVSTPFDDNNLPKYKWHQSWINYKHEPSQATKDDFLFDDNITTPRMNSISSQPETKDFPLTFTDGNFSGTPPGAGASLLGTSTDKVAPKASFSDKDVVSGQTGSRRIGFIFDSTLTAFLMMGNLGLKSHAVTMFEVGKLADESLDEFIAQLDQREGATGEGDAARYYEHAFTLRNTLRLLRHNPSLSLPNSDGGLDLLRCDSLNALDGPTRMRILNKNYALLISMAPLSLETRPISFSLPPHFGPPVCEANSFWMKMFFFAKVGRGTVSMCIPKGSRIFSLPSFLEGDKVIMTASTSGEPMILTIDNLLPALNDALLASPILVQVYSKLGANAQFVHIPFPFQPSDYENKLNEQGKELVSRIQKALDLSSSLGYITLISYGGKHGDEWIPYDLRFGMPLFDSELNNILCGKLPSLFTSDNLKSHVNSARRFSIQFLEFISDAIEVPTDFEAKETAFPFPSRTIYFDGTRMIKS